MTGRKSAGVARIGISGWRYGGWRGVWYPKGLAQARELEFAARRLSSIEINGTFYSLQRAESFRRWAAAVPDGFVFAVKGGRFITHMKKLRDVEVPLANFFASGVLELGDRLGPILWQLPPSLGFDAARLQGFLRLLPRDTAQAFRLASRHDDRVPAPIRPKPPARPLRHALEVRHASWDCPDAFALLREHGVALVVADTAGRWPQIDVATADFTYARLHGDQELYVSGYDDAALDAWAARARSWLRRGDAYVYFDNDAKVRAPFDALALARRLGARPAGAGDESAPPDVVPEDEAERAAEMAQRWRRRVTGAEAAPRGRRPR